MLLLRETAIGKWFNEALDRVDLWLFPAVLIIAWIYYPYSERGPDLCIFKILFHHACPGCGLTRSICFLVHGRLREAMEFNPLSILVLLLMIITFLRAILDLRHRETRELVRRKYPV